MKSTAHTVRLIGLILFTMLILTYVFFREKLGITEEAIHTLVDSAGPWAYIVYIMLVAATMAIAPAPVGPVILIGAKIFGVWDNLLFSLIGITLGGAAAFAAGRYLGRPFLHQFVQDRSEEIIASLPKRATFWSVFFMRFVSIPSVDFVSFAAGFTTISWPAYLLATALGMTPMVILWTFYGGLLLEGSFWTFGMGITIFILGYILNKKYSIGKRISQFAESRITLFK